MTAGENAGNRLARKEVLFSSPPCRCQRAWCLRQVSTFGRVVVVLNIAEGQDAVAEK